MLRTYFYRAVAELFRVCLSATVRLSPNEKQVTLRLLDVLQNPGLIFVALQHPLLEFLL